MFENIRFKAGAYLAHKASEEVSKGDFKSIMKGLKYLKMSVKVTPPCKELNKLADGLREIVTEYKH